MKYLKYTLIIIPIISLTACHLANTPTSIVEDYGVSKYTPVIATLLKNPTLILPQQRGVNDIEDGIDSSKEAGKLLISIIAAVAEMERKNIRVQTMAGREQKAREATSEQSNQISLFMREFMKQLFPRNTGILHRKNSYLC